MGNASMPTSILPDYPFCLPSYVAAFDDGALAKQELKEETRSWRSEGYATDSSVQIFDHTNGEGKKRVCNDEQITKILVTWPPRSRYPWGLALTGQIERATTTASIHLALTDGARKDCGRGQTEYISGNTFQEE
jgi:hypothetical protein